MRSLLVLASLAFTAPAFAADRPNFVFVLVDDLRFDGLHCTGHPFAKSPNVDRLAKEGVTFTNAFVSIPLCSPSRSSFLTGKYAHSTGVTGNGNNADLSHKLVTFPRLLHNSGYSTAYVGKWHMGNDDSPRPGFDRWVSFKGQGNFIDPPMNIDGKETKATGYMTDILTKHAVDFVKAQKAEKPFCLYLAHKAVHGPFTPAERHKGMFANTPFPGVPTASDDRAGKPAITQNLGKETPKKKAKEPAAKKANYGTMRDQMECLVSIDEGVGEILKALEESKQLDNTVFVFTSDNGYFWGDHGGLGDKRWAYEPSIRVPFIVRYPKFAKAGLKVPQMVLNIDIAPTFLQLAGVNAPDDMQGRSFAKLLNGAPFGGWRTSMLTEYFREGMQAVPTWHAVRSEEWKYIQYDGHPEWDELYDLKNDPNERKNLVKDEAVAEPLKTMKSELSRLLQETGSPK